MEQYKNKKFTDLLTGKVVEVIDHFEDIVILDNKSKIKLNKLLDGNFYDEYIDPRNFFKNESLVNAFTEKIRQLPNENIKYEQERFDPKNPPVLKNYGDPMRPLFDEPAVLPYDQEEEKKELMEKAKRMYQNFTDKSGKQYENLKGIIEDIDDEYDASPRTINQELPKPINQNLDTKPIINDIIMNNQVDPIIQMFRNAKRNTDFKISFNINNKIPRIDFIEMMEDSYNTSIIDFLSEEFTNELLLKPETIKNKIKDQLIEMVYNAKQKANVVQTPPIVKPTTTKKRITKQDD
jgi:hypothetical protein